MARIVRVDTKIQTVSHRLENWMILDPLDAADLQITRRAEFDVDVVFLEVFGQFWIIKETQPVPNPARMTVLQCVPYGLGTTPFSCVDLNGNAFICEEPEDVGIVFNLACLLVASQCQPVDVAPLP